MFGFTEGLQRGTPKAVLAGVSPLTVVLLNPLIQIGLQVLQCGIDFLAKGNGIELVLNGAMKTFADAIGLRMTGFGLAVVDGLNC